MIAQTTSLGNITESSLNNNRNELSVIAKNVNLGNITPSFLNNNLTQFKKEINSFKDKNKINYSDRFTDTDRDYLSAVERGDMETAQKMVDEAA